MRQINKYPLKLTEIAKAINENYTLVNNVKNENQTGNSSEKKKKQVVQKVENYLHELGKELINLKLEV
ncbi:MAG: hypothetical protein HN704_14655 [Bacteroidetes bacterium]|jgi:hypothetical protein|nr:hypothetical protein [Bacteroidota bacterium]MBT7492838.1 hypothetical protein [Bacteroidota bacterium]